MVTTTGNGATPNVFPTEWWFQIFMFYLHTSRKWSTLTNIFQMNKKQKMFGVYRGLYYLLMWGLKDNYKEPKWVAQAPTSRCWWSILEAPQVALCAGTVTTDFAHGRLSPKGWIKTCSTKICQIREVYVGTPLHPVAVTTRDFPCLVGNPNPNLPAEAQHPNDWLITSSPFIPFNPREISLEKLQVQQRYRSIEAIFRESFEHMENEARNNAMKSLVLESHVVHIIYIYIYCIWLYRPRTCLSSILGLQPSRRRPFPIKTRVIGFQGYIHYTWCTVVCIYLHIYIYIHYINIWHMYEQFVFDVFMYTSLSYEVLQPTYDCWMLWGHLWSFWDASIKEYQMTDINSGTSSGCESFYMSLGAGAQQWWWYAASCLCSQHF